MANKLNPAIGYIGNALRSAAKDHITSFAEDTYDEHLEDYQGNINSKHEASLQQLDAKNQEQDAAIRTKAEKSEVATELDKKANAEDVNNSMQELDKKLNRNLLAIEFDDETGDLNAIIGQDSTISSVSTDEDGNVIIEQEII